MVTVTITKKSVMKPVAQLVRYDRRTSGVLLRIPRYDSGVDLSELHWTIKIVNAAEDSNVIEIAPEAGEEELTYEWIFSPVVASAAGMTVFEVEGTAGDTNEKVWQSGRRTIEVVEDLDALPGVEPEDYETVNQRFNRISADIDVIEETIDGLNRDFELTLDRANEAADNAEAVYNKVKTELDNGGLVGPRGEKGDTGDPGFDPIVSLTKTEGVVTLTITAANGTHSATVKDGERGPQGIRGERGFTGPQGDKGPKGDPGISADQLNAIIDRINRLCAINGIEGI